jgi:hypothetical protein
LEKLRKHPLYIFYKNNIFMSLPIIPGPNNELITQSLAIPPQYPISASISQYAVTASYAIGPEKKWGAWYSTTTQTASFTNIAYPVTVNTLTGTNGFYISGSNGSTVSGSAIVIPKTATYDFQFSLQFFNTGGGGGESAAFVWLRVNGIDVPYSSTRVSVNTNSPYMVAAWDFMGSYNIGDKLELMWLTNNVGVVVKVDAPTGESPNIPSVIFTIMEL